MKVIFSIEFTAEVDDAPVPDPTSGPYDEHMFELCDKVQALVDHGSIRDALAAIGMSVETAEAHGMRRAKGTP